MVSINNFGKTKPVQSTNTITRDKERHCIIIKVYIQEDISIENMNALKIRAPKYIKQILTEIKEILTVAQ